MTRAEFISEHGKAWRAFSQKPIFDALLSMIDSESPTRALPSKLDNDRLHGAVVFMNEIAGWEKLRLLLVNLSTESAPDAEVPDTFKDPEIS